MSVLASKKPNPTIGLTIVRRLKAAPSKVFAAWARPTTLNRWFAPGGDMVTGAESELREGGQYRIDAVDMHGRPYSISGTYVELVEDQRIVLSWNYDGPVSALRTKAALVSAELRELGPKLTELTLTHEKNPDREVAAAPVKVARRHLCNACSANQPGPRSTDPAVS